MTFRIPIDPTAGVSPSLNSEWRTLWSGTYRPQTGEPTTALVSAIAYAGDGTVGQIRVVVPGSNVASDPVIVSAQQPVSSHVIALVECGVADTPILIEGRRVSGDEGVWVVEAAAVALSATASEVLPGPRIGLQPEDVSVSSGSTATVTVGAEGIASVSGQTGLLYRLLECPSKTVVEEKTSAGLVEFDIARAEGAYSYQIQVLNDFGVVLSREFSVTFEQVPATIAQLVGPSSWYLGQPAAPGDLVASVTGSAPVVVSWERRFASGLWETVGQETEVVGGMSTLALDPADELGSYEWRATASNAAGTDTEVHAADVVEPNGAAVLSWASADFNMGDVLAPGEIRWLTYIGDTEQMDDRNVRMFGSFEAAAGTKALLQMSSDQQNWSDRSSLVQGLGDPISVSLDVQVEEGTSYWRWVADPDGEFVTSPVATVTIALTADSEPPVLTVDPVASGPGPIVVSGTVSDNIAVVVVGVVFRQNGVNVAGQNAQPDGDAWSVTWNPAAGGLSGSGFVAHVTALDVQGNEVIVDSNAFTIGAAGSDVTPPVSTIDTVASGAGVFSLSGTSTDVESGVAEVLLKMWAYNGTPVGPTAGVVATLSGDNWTADFDPSPHIGSGVVATLHATDAAGNEAAQVVSNPFNVTSTPPQTGSIVFDNGQPGVAGDPYVRRVWFWLYNRAYFEPAHSQINASPQRAVYVSPSGGGTGLTPSSTVTLNGYTAMAQPGDQVRMMPGVHDTDGQFRSIQGTAANPIRFVRHDAGIAPTVRNLSGSTGRPTWGFTDSMHLGVHGIEVDGQSADNWGLAFGRVWDNDQGRIRCHNIDVWHCHIHHMGQTVTKAAGTQGATAKTLGPGPDNLSHHIHHYANEVSHSGQSSGNQLSELMYAGDGNTAADHVDDFIVEACHIHHSNGGEAVDLKQEQTGAIVVGCNIHTIRVNSQGAVVAQNSGPTVCMNVIWDVHRSLSNSYDTSAVFVNYGLVEDIVCWDLGASAVGYMNKRSSETLTLRRVCVWDAQQNYGNVSMLLKHSSSPPLPEKQYHEDGSGTPTVVVIDCISGDGSYTGGGSTSGPRTSGVSYTAHDSSIADFVGPVLGSAEAVSGRPGTGFALAAGSSIPASAEPQGLS